MRPKRKYHNGLDDPRAAWRYGDTRRAASSLRSTRTTHTDVFDEMTLIFSLVPAALSLNIRENIIIYFKKELFLIFRACLCA